MKQHSLKSIWPSRNQNISSITADAAVVVFRLCNFQSGVNFLGFPVALTQNHHKGNWTPKFLHNNVMISHEGVKKS